ncbi:MAG: hypothetical protein OXF02_06230 [Simkaniaceae bacterium]|nr:hypothetical protein [Simkaniaceae bacterium]
MSCLLCCVGLSGGPRNPALDEITGRNAGCRRVRFVVDRIRCVFARRPSEVSLPSEISLPRTAILRSADRRNEFRVIRSTDRRHVSFVACRIRMLERERSEGVVADDVFLLATSGNPPFDLELE